jgi:transposase
MERPAPVRIFVGHPHWAGGANIRKEPAVASVAHLAPIHLGLDVHRDTISVGILGPGEEVPAVDKIAHDEPSVRRLVGRLGDRRRLRACYEAGPTGFELARLLHSMGVSCQVIAPSLIPKAPGDRVKTDKRDCRRLARLYRAGELVAIRIPTPTEEAVRDLCRTRGDMVQDRMRARHRLSKFLLRHGQVWRDGKAWTLAHERWLLTQRFTEPALQTTYDHYRAVLASRDAQLEAIQADLAIWQDRAPFAEAVARLSAYRGVTRLGALHLAAEVGDWRRFARASAFMGFCGLVPSEYSSGQVTHRGHITKAGNVHLRTQLVESAWAYQHHPSVGARLASRQQGLDPQVVARAWAAQLRLSGRFRRLAANKSSTNIVAAAIARELAGFLWAEMTA